MSAQQWILLATQASVMLGVFAYGLACSVSDLAYILRRPRRLLKSLIAMFVVMPVVAVLLVRYFDFHHAVEVALVALALSPVPPLLVKKQAKASEHGAHALGLMVTMAILSIGIAPLGVAIMARVFDQSLSVSPMAIATVIAKTVLLPLVLGMLARFAFPALAERMARPAGLIGMVILVLAALLILVGSAHALWAQVGDGTLPCLFVFIAVGLFTGHWLGGPAPRDRAVLALSTASRHPGIAMAIASLNFPGEPGLGSAILLYMLLNIVVSLPYVRWQRAQRVEEPTG